MSKLIWDALGERIYETGLDRGVLFPYTAKGYQNGVAWNGLTSVNEAPTGAESTPLYANNKKYLNLRSKEDWAGSIGAYTYPDEFAECDGSMSIANGVTVGQQPRKPFGLCYRTLIGNDTEDTDFGYKIHLVYGCSVSPSDRDHGTTNESPEATEMSWDVETTPVECEINGKTITTATVEIDSTKVDSAKLKELENILYGTDEAESRFPLPDEIATLFGGSSSETE